MKDVKLKPLNCLSVSARDDEWALRLQRVTKAGVWSTVIEDGISWWSEGVFALYDLPMTLKIAPNMEDHFLDGSAAVMVKAISVAIETAKGWSVEAPFVTAKGRKLWVRSMGEVTRLPNGKTMLYGAFQDITSYHEDQLKILESHLFVESVLDNLPHMVFVKEAKDLRFVRVNKAGEQLLGVSSAALIGKNDFDLFPTTQAEFYIEKDRQVLEKGGTLDIPEEVIDGPSGRRLLHTKKIAINDERGFPKYLIGISEDITEAHDRRGLIERQRAALENSTRLAALGEMAGGIAHEINNPMAIIDGKVTQVINRIKSGNIDPEILCSDLEKVKSTVARISKIVRSLRQIARDGDHDAFNKSSVKIIIDDTVELCRQRFRDASIDLRLSGVSDVMIECRSVQISQTLLNLLNNAYDAVQALSLSDERWVSLAVSDAGGFVEISVTDSGSSIPSDVVSKMMHPFFTTKDVGQGTGLGLSIARSLVQSHGGDLRYIEASKNTQFVLSLPKTQTKRSAA